MFQILNLLVQLRKVIRVKMSMAVVFTNKKKNLKKCSSFNENYRVIHDRFELCQKRVVEKHLKCPKPNDEL